MGFVIDPNKWRANSLKGLNCAIFPCYNRPTNRCPRCSIWSCYEHVKSHLHMERPEDRQNQNDDIYRMR